MAWSMRKEELCKRSIQTWDGKPFFKDILKENADLLPITVQEVPKMVTILNSYDFFFKSMVDKWNKNQLKAETLKFYYIYLFTFQTFSLRPQYSFDCEG